MPARTFTTAGVNNLWSNAANWDGGLTIPAENDSVTIPAGQTCEYDYNSAYTTGIAGITVTGTLKLTRSAGTYRLFMKAATTIAGAGTFDCGASALDAIPFATKHTITGGAGWYINGASGLTMTVYAAEPAIKTILLSGDEAIGQTILSVDTDVTGDIWADGDTIRIDDIQGASVAPESEERVIAAGGRAAGTITITAGLTAAKSTGAVVSLITRNVKFIGLGDHLLKSFAAGKLTIAGGQFTAPAKYILSSCSGVIVGGGSFSGSSYIGVVCANLIISGGVFSGNTTGFDSCNATQVIGGYFSGQVTIFQSCVGTSITGGVIKGNGYVLTSVVGGNVSLATVYGNRFFVNTCSGIKLLDLTVSKCDTGVRNSSVSIANVTLSLNTSADIASSVVSAVNTLFNSATENSNYTLLAKEIYSESFDHDQVAGAFKAWTKGGVTTKQATTYPVGKTYSMQLVLENATNEGFWQREVTVGAGASINITSHLRKSASMTYLPRVIIFNKASADPFAGGAGIDTFTMTDSVDTWESDTYTYYNSTSEDVTIVIRTQGMNASGNVFSLIEVEQINVDLTTLINNLAVVDANVDSILVDTTLALDVLMNKMITDPTTGIMTLYNDAGVAMLTAQLYEDAAGLQTYRGKGAERRERLT